MDGKNLRKIPASRWLGPVIGVVLLSLSFMNPQILERVRALVKSTPSAKVNFELNEISQAAGLDHRHEISPVDPTVRHFENWLTSIGASVSVVDYDNDGWQDIYFTNTKLGSFNKMYRNLGNGKFRDVAQELGIADVNQKHGSTRAAFFDMDNDGDKDMLLVSYCPQLFENIDGKKFELSQRSSDFGCTRYMAPAAIVDLDNDGLLDVILAAHYEFDLAYDLPHTRIYANNFWTATNGQPVAVFMNRSQGHFEHVPKAYGIDFVGWHHDIGVGDLFDRGMKDIWFAEDYTYDKVFFRETDNAFREVSKQLAGSAFNRNGMSVSIGDIDNDGKLAVFISQIYKPKFKGFGNLLWKLHSPDNVEQVAYERGVDDCDWAWGSKFVDINNDTWLDLVVGNGLFSGPKPETGVWFTLTTLDSARNDLIEDVMNWFKLKDHTFEGYQKPCLFLNDGTGHFVNVTEKTALREDKFDHRGIALIDHMNDGNMSLAIANQKQKATLYQVMQKNDHKWIGFNLEGTKSNRDAIGTRVRVYLKNGSILRRELQPFNGYSSQSDSRVHFGLGRNPVIEKIEILWPSGQKMKIKDLGLDQYHSIKEDI